MTVSTTIRKAGPFAGTGLVSSYPFAFKVFTDDDLLVIRTPTGGADVTLALASDYTVTLNPDQDAVPGGSVVLSAPLAVGYTLSIGSQVDSLQGLSLTNNGGFFPKAIEAALDKLDIQDQQQEETLSRAVRVPFGSGAIPDLPAPSAGSALVWNTAGTALENGAPGVNYDTLRSDLAGTGSGQGASLVGLQDAGANYQSTTVEGSLTELAARELSNGISVLKYIPMSYWATLAAGTETADMGGYINQAIAAAAVDGGIVKLPPWTFCHSTQITWGASGTDRAVGIDGNIEKFGITASAARGACLKWTGASGATQLLVVHGAHHARVSNITFDANDLANTCVHFETVSPGGSTYTLFRPRLRDCQFTAYRGKAVVFGNPDLTVSEPGQLQLGEVTNCSWLGGGPTATVANVIGLVLNAQNLEELICTSLYFDPFTVVGGGPNINHEYHIATKQGSLNLRGGLFTRSSNYNIKCYGDAAVVIDHCRTEDPLFIQMAEALASNPVMITNVEGRDGTATGAEFFMDVRGGGNCIVLENIRSTGSIRLAGVTTSTAMIRNVQFIPGSSTTGALSYTSAPQAPVVEETEPGRVRVYNDDAFVEWKNAANAVLYKNDRGTEYVTGLQKAAGTDPNRCVNFCGKVGLNAAATTATVTFATAEADANYMPILSLDGTTGAIAAGSTTIVGMTKLAGSFTFTVAAAPGAGTTTTWNWLITRR